MMSEEVEVVEHEGMKEWMEKVAEGLNLLEEMFFEEEEETNFVLDKVDEIAGYTNDLMRDVYKLPYRLDYDFRQCVWYVIIVQE